MLLPKDYSFLRKNYVNCTWHFVKFHGSPWQIAVSSALGSQLKKSAAQNMQDIVSLDC